MNPEEVYMNLKSAQFAVTSHCFYTLEELKSVLPYVEELRQRSLTRKPGEYWIFETWIVDRQKADILEMIKKKEESGHTGLAPNCSVGISPIYYNHS